MARLSIVPGLKRFNQTGWGQIQENAYALSFEKELLLNLPQIKGIVLLGEFDHIVGYKDQIRILADKIERVKQIKSSGHNLPIDKKQMVTLLFNDFLAC